MDGKIILVRHDDGPEDDRVADFLARSGLATQTVRPFAAEVLPADRSEVAGCVIYGGLYNAYDLGPHPFLRDQYAFIERCLRWDVPMLGICLGAQQIAHHLGAHVGELASGAHEFGYYELRPSPEAGSFLSAPMYVAESHRHGFDLPSGAIHLASTETFPNQAYRIGERVFGFQFHAEVTAAAFRRWQDGGTARYGLPGVQPRDEQDRLMALHDRRQAQWLENFLGGLFPAHRDG
ncbi:MAG: glutamine amidotransferase [Rhizobiaceae bacterium]|nr:glutamine amidotransferase [Rhizobiaceae bacterium]